MNKHAIIGLVLGASIVAGTLLSGNATINLKHKPQYPISKSNNLICQEKAKVCDVNLNTYVGKQTKYAKIAEGLQALEPGYTINVHLAGPGGYVAGLTYLHGVLSRYEGKTNAVVVGDVYSAHAFLATSMDELEVHGTPNMLFHTTSGYKSAVTNCRSMVFRPILEPITDYQTGKFTIRETPSEYLERLRIYMLVVQPKDRGINALDKCIQVSQGLSNNFHKNSMKALSKVLTKEELVKYDNGEDIIIEAKEIERRFNGQ